MPKKGLFQGIQKDEHVTGIHEKIAALEKQVEKINTLEGYIKRFIKVEERIGLLSLKGKLEQVESINMSHRVQDADWENQILSKVQQLIKMELEPFQQLMV